MHLLCIPVFFPAPLLKWEGGHRQVCLLRERVKSPVLFQPFAQHDQIIVSSSITWESISSHLLPFAGLLIIACHHPPALVLLLLHFPPHSHFPMLEQWQGSKWLPRQRWWTSARSQEKKLNLSNLASESGTCLSRISKTSRTSSLVNLYNAHTCRYINKVTFLLPNLWIKHCYLEKGLLLFQHVALYCILMSE